ncbi:armadillo repeat-containing protein 3-like isoform X2 [Babylonia areolata]|uniref:armadillo repeat-containing protein 3-like isoform X2 n=1 Tax=Babylonia areolata TaxID=304850 RepID=UPI003FD1A770
MGKKIKKDEKPPHVDVFDPLLVESRQAATVVLMLSSPEEDVQSKACEAIYKFVDKCDENKKLLLDLNAVDPLLNLMQGEDCTVRRNATMALSVMCQNADVRRCLRKKDNSIPALINLIQPEIGDLVVNEFAALAVSFMAIEYSSKVTIFDNGGIEPLVRLLPSVDPDIQKNSIEALAQLMLDHQARASVREYDGFTPILELLRSEYAIIQKLALLTLDRLMQDAENRAVMRELDGISKLLDFLGRPEWQDLHIMVIMVIASMLEDQESLEQMKESGGLKKLVALITDQPPPDDDSKKGDKKGGSRAGKKSAGKDGKGKKGGDDEEKETVLGGESIIPTLPDVKMCAAKAIGRCARNSDNRKLLHEQETEKMLIALLASDSPEVQTAATQALGVMCENLSCRDAIREWEGIPPLARLMSTDNGDLKEAVTLALANLTTANTQNCQELVNLNSLDMVLGALSDGREEVVANAACILTNLAQDEGLRAEAQNKGAITYLIEPLKSSNTTVQSRAALAISTFACDADPRAEFRENGGLEPLLMLLHSGNNEVRRNAAWAMTVVGIEEATALEICKMGGLEILQQIQLSSTRQSPFIDGALERLLDSNLSAKYSLTGHLSSLNLIDDGFFDPGQVKPGTKMRQLEEYLGDAVHDKRPVFYVSAKQEARREQSVTPVADLPSENVKEVRGIMKKRISIAPEKQEDADSKADTKSVSGKTAKTSKQDSKGKSKAQREKEEKQKEEELAAQLQKEAEALAEKDQKPLEPPTDPAFIKYLEDVTDKILPLPSTKEQIKALAQFVAEKMGGAIEKGQLPYFGWELPMSQLRVDCKSNVIPIGKIKMGVHPHRALLFKALADRLSIGCTLTRGQYNRAWNEVMISEDENNADAKFPPQPFIVDLIHEPGNLLAQDTADYVAYQKI